MSVLSHILVVHKGGVVLWSGIFTPGQFSPNQDENVKTVKSKLDAVITYALIEGKSSEELFKQDGCVLKWKQSNEKEIVVIGIFPAMGGVSELSKSNEVITKVLNKFISSFLSDRRADPWEDYSSFNKTFESIKRRIYENNQNEGKAKLPRTFEETQKGKEINTTKNEASATEENKSKKKKKKKGKKSNNNNEAAEEGEENGSPAEDNKNEETAINKETSDAGDGEEKEDGLESGSSGNIGELSRSEKLKILQAKRGRGRGSPAARPTKKTPPPKKGKELRTWGDKGGEEEPMDYSDEKPQEQQTKSVVISGAMDLDKWDDGSSDEEDSQEPKAGGGFFSKYFSVLSNRELTEENLKEVLDAFRSHLVEKNVASDIADKLCESVKSNLLGKSVPSFTTITSTVRKAMEDALVQILSPSQPIDILRDCQKVNQSGNPYVIVFVGINGVGKSTNLAKVCYWLQSNGLKAMIAACDTFRSGAVEQLKVHSRALNVELYDQGYGKDAAQIARAAIAHAKSKGVNVVLVDTAGRMQDNEPLMKSLANLVHLNKPNLVLFVGEALVGNDGVDQLVKFNAALRDNTPAGATPRIIDAIILSKFDTIDDKVGAALSMAYVSGQQILFVGTGQTYTDLKKMNLKVVTKALLK